MAKRRGARLAEGLPGENFGRAEPVNAEPPRYTPELAAQVRAACEAGYTMSELCRLIGVGLDTMNLWRIIYPAFARALEVRNMARTARVEDALYQRAIGYEQPTEKLFYNKDDGLVRAPTMLHVPADPVAARSWLEAHRPEVYVRRQAEDGQPSRLVVEIVGHPGPLEMDAKDGEDTGPDAPLGTGGGLPPSA